MKVEDCPRAEAIVIDRGARCAEELGCRLVAAGLGQSQRQGLRERFEGQVDQRIAGAVQRTGRLSPPRRQQAARPAVGRVPRSG